MIFFLLTKWYLGKFAGIKYLHKEYNSGIMTRQSIYCNYDKKTYIIKKKKGHRKRKKCFVKDCHLRFNFWSFKVHLVPFASFRWTSPAVTWVILVKIWVEAASDKKGREISLELARALQSLAPCDHMSCNMTKPTNWVCAQRRLRSAWASAQSDQSLHCPHEETLGP